MDENKTLNFYESLPEYLQYFIMKADLMSPREVLSAKNSIFQNLGAPIKSIQQLKLEAAKFLHVNFTSVPTLINDYSKNWSEKLSFGCKSIDNCTNGGILRRGIIEICGESGAGKTQIMLQLCLNVQLPLKLGGFSQNAVFISTEKMFPSKRLDQLLEHFESKFKENIKYLDGIFLKHIYESSELTKCIECQLPNLIQKHNIGLIVIDSIAAIYRTDSNYIKRAKDMRRIAHSLLTLVEKFKCAVVCVNQVASVQNNLVPCLGLAWSHLVRTRLKVSKPSENELWHKHHRKFEILFSPELPNRICEFSISAEGIVDVT